VTYEEVYAALDKIKRFTIDRRHAQDKRRKSAELVWEQMDSAYRTCCVAANHIRTAERKDNGVTRSGTKGKQGG
jgi:hypothetical protein